jgi:uncharacterized protein
MKLWVDADAGPGEMKDVIFRAGKRLGIHVTLVANASLAVPAAYTSGASSVCVKGGADVADQYIVDHAAKGDLAVTADIALAARLVPMGVFVVDPRGHEYTADAVGERLSVRDFMEEMRGAGLVTGGPAPYGPKDKKAFAATLDRLLTRARRST